VFTENSIRAESTMISSACSHSPPEKLIEATVQQRCNGVLNGKAESARKNPVWAHGRLSFQRCVLPAICRSPWAKLGMKSFALESSVLHRSPFRESSRFTASVSIRQPQDDVIRFRALGRGYIAKVGWPHSIMETRLERSPGRSASRNSRPRRCKCRILRVRER
jgi:hypothetical protein